MEQLFDFEKLTKELKLLIKEAVSFCKTQQADIEKKELNDISTFSDRYIEKKLSDFIHLNFKDHTIVGEENGSNNIESDYEWLIDPIDGTVNYSSGIPMYGCSIALRYKHESIFGLIYDIPNDNFYSVIKGEGAYFDNKKLSVSNRTKLDESIVTICLTSSYDEELTDRVLKLLKILQPKVRGIRIIVCTVYELIWLAKGYTDVMINIKPSIGVGSAAGKLLVTEAGGEVTNILGKPRDVVDTLLVSNGKLHSQIVDLIKDI